MQSSREQSEAASCNLFLVGCCQIGCLGLSILEECHQLASFLRSQIRFFLLIRGWDSKLGLGYRWCQIHLEWPNIIELLSLQDVISLTLHYCTGWTAIHSVSLDIVWLKTLVIVALAHMVLYESDDCFDCTGWTAVHSVVTWHRLAQDFVIVALAWSYGALWERWLFHELVLTRQCVRWHEDVKSLLRCCSQRRRVKKTCIYWYMISKQSRCITSQVNNKSMKKSHMEAELNRALQIVVGLHWNISEKLNGPNKAPKSLNIKHHRSLHEKEKNLRMQLHAVLVVVVGSGWRVEK